MTEQPERSQRVRPSVPSPWRLTEPWNAWLLLLVLGVVYALTASYSVAQNNDSRAAAMGAWSLGTRGTVVLPQAWPEEGVSWPVVDDDGSIRVNRFPGVLFWGAPFYAAAELVGGGVDEPAHPYLLDYRPAAVAAIVAALLALLVSFLVFLKLCDRRASFVATLVLAFATSTWSISANALWTHALTHLFLVAGVLLLASERAWASGAAFGLSIFTRPQTAVVPAVVGLWRAITLRRPSDLVRIGIPSALGLLGVVAYSWVQFRNPLPTSGYSDYAVRAVTRPSLFPLPERIFGTLFDPRRGLVFQAPFLVVLLPGLRAAWRAAPSFVRSAALAGVAYMLLQLQLNDYTGGRFFALYRLPLEMLVLAAPLLVLAYQAFIGADRIRRMLFWAAVAMSVVFQVLGVTLWSVERHVDPVLRPAVEQLCRNGDVECTVDELLG